MKKCIIQIAIVMFMLSISEMINAQCHIDDWYALRLLYINTDGDNWTNNSGWEEVSTNAPPDCNLDLMDGVGLDEQGRVDSLFFRYRQFSGNLPPELGNLSNLRFLILSPNQLSGSLPAEIGNLSNLEYLNLSYNQFSDPLPPEIGNLTNLRELYLNNNQFSGSLPAELGNLANLTRLDLQYNQFSGILSAEIGNLSNLKYLHLFDNLLNGSLPAEIGNLSKLISLDLFNNLLNGSLPAEIGNLSNLEMLNLFNNQFSGNLPTELGNLSNLERLNLFNNQFSGNLPATFCNLTNVFQLEIINNNFQGCYPTCLSTFCTQLIGDASGSNTDLNDGNNFDATWEDFCATGAGICAVSDVYPGDLNHDGIVNNQDIGLCGLNLYEIGPPRAPEHQNTIWQAYPADDWNRQHLNNEDIKHFDSNGDGAITPNDHQAVEDNFGLMWSDTIPPPPPPPQSDYQTMLLPTEQIVDGYLFLNISLERRAGGDLTLQGGYFTIDYSDITGTINFASLGLNNESWLGTRDGDLFFEFEEFPTQKKIEIGFTKTDNLNSTGSGVIGELIISYNSSQSRMNGNPIDTQKIKISTIGVHNGNDFTLLEDEIKQVYMGDNSCQANWTITENTPFQNQYKSNSNITTDGFVLIGTDQEVEFNAGNRVRINEGFSVKAGADFKVRVSGCD